MGDDGSDLDAEIRELSLRVERTIAKNEALLDRVGPFKPRTQRTQAQQYLGGSLR